MRERNTHRNSKVCRKAGRPLQFEQLEQRCLFAVSAPLLNSWFLAGQGQNAQVISQSNVAAGPSPTWSTNATPTLGDITKVSSSANYVYVNTADFSSYVMGPWFLANGNAFPNYPSNQNALYRIREGAYPDTTNTHGVPGNGAVGVLVNGVSVFNNGDAFTYNNATSADANPGSKIWFRRAAYAESATFDHAKAHQPAQGQYHNHVNPTALRAQLNDNIDYIGTTNFFPYDPAAILSSGQGADKTYRERTVDLHHSPILGWSFDGHPIYGPYGYSNPNDSNSTIQRIASSFVLRNVTNRTTLPGWAAQISFPAAGVALDGVYTLAAGEYGPTVNATNPLGKYGEDYQFVPGLSTLDQYNGRFTKTPEFPNGVYAYFSTIDANGAPAFPDMIGRQFYGPTNSGRVANTNGDGTVATLFDVATNTAPAMSGPSSATVTNGAVFTFTSANTISVSDVDAATLENVSLSVTIGLLNVNLSGTLASGATIFAGANNSSSLTLRGGISQLNAALATLTYTAPLSGNNASLTVQANDGSLANNLSNIVTTSITLVAPPAASIVTSQVFYNESDFESNAGLNTPAGVAAALDSPTTGKRLLQSGAASQASTFANVSSYSKGINGIVIDVNNLASSTLSTTDFTFRVAPSLATGAQNVSSWSTAPAPIAPINVSVLSGTTSRIRIEWADNAIQNTWLQVILKANANTRLALPAVFYIGHALGDVNGSLPYRVNNSDLAAIQPFISANPISITDPRDVNKDRKVNNQDLSFVQTKVSAVTLLNNITIPIAGSANEGSGSGFGSLVLAISGDTLEKSVAISAATTNESSTSSASSNSLPVLAAAMVAATASELSAPAATPRLSDRALAAFLLSIESNTETASTASMHIDDRNQFRKRKTFRW